MSKEAAEAICLVKPQFEIGRNKVGKGGVVRTMEDHISVLDQVINQVSQIELFAQQIIHSPIKGQAGNIEFLLHLSRKADPAPIDVPSLVSTAHANLNKAAEEQESAG